MALQYELEVLDELISENFHPKNLINGNSPVTPQQVNAWLNKALSEENKIRKRLKLVTYGFLKEKHKRIYIQQHQSAIIRLLDRIVNYLYPKDIGHMLEQKTDTPVEKLYKRVFGSCRELLDYIQETFPEYFSHDLKIPDFLLMQSQLQWEFRLSSIRRQLQKIKADKKLVQLLFSILSNICDHTNCISLSYRTHTYINDLLSGLENIKEVKNTNNSCPPLNRLLVSLDFNETGFKDYLVEMICENVNIAKTVKEKIDRLSFYYKEIGQMHRKPGVSFHHGVRSVKDDLKEWLAREIRYLEKSENLGIIVPARFHDSPQYKRGIWYTYTIEELALLQRIQHEANYITNSNIIAMMEDLSKIAHTATQHNISYKNLKNLFYNIDLNTIDSLHEKLLILIRKLQNIKAVVIKKEKTKRSANKK